jgi:hypothetical protein
MKTRTDLRQLRNALPFWMSLGLLPLVALGAWYGGWTLLLLPLYGWGMVTVLDAVTGLDRSNPETEVQESDLFWYRLITIIWFPIQFAVIFGAIWWVGATDHLWWLEKIVLFFGVGVISGAIGITYAHELLHQKNRPSAGSATCCWQPCSTAISARSTCRCITACRHPARPGHGALQRGVSPLFLAGAARLPALGLAGRGGDAGAAGSAVVAPLEPVLALWPSANCHAGAGLRNRRLGGAGRCSSTRPSSPSGNWN